MMDWMTILILALAIVLIIASIFSVYQKDLLLAVLGTSAVSVVLSALYFILQAPDVALTEAAIGVALTTVIFVITIKKTKRYEE
jgi:uncharacterized MnhB-related membrane protein